MGALGQFGDPSQQHLPLPTVGTDPKVKGRMAFGWSVAGRVQDSLTSRSVLMMNQ